MIMEIIRKKIETCGKTRYRISKDTGIDEAALCRIMQGKTCTAETADVLLKYFKLGINSKGKQMNISSTSQSNKNDESAKFHRQSWKGYTKPYFWLVNATALYEAANAFRDKYWPAERRARDTKAAYSDFYRGPVYMLLAGLALETLIKGIIVGRNPEVVGSQRLSKKLTNHNLIDLYREAGLRKIKYQNDLLLRLQNYIEIFGRYPVAKSKKDMEKMSNTRFAGQADPNSINRIWKYLVPKIQTYIQDAE